jgi:hypothetical protein
VDALKTVWEGFVNLFASFYKFLYGAVWAVMDRFVPEAREGYPYIMWDVIATVAANSSNTPFNAANLTNTTSDEFVVDYFRFEGAPAAAYLAAGGLSVMGGAQDFNLRVRVKDLSHNADIVRLAIPIGLLIDPVSRRYYPQRRIVLTGGQNAGLEITVDNTSGGPLNNVYVAVHGHMRSRKNMPQ